MENCAACQELSRQEKQLDTLLRSQSLIQAPKGLQSRILAELPVVKTPSSLPDWLQAFALGLIVIFMGVFFGNLGKPVIKELRLILEDRFEKTVLMDPLHGISLETAENRHGLSLGLKRADHDHRLAIDHVAVNAQNVERRAMVAANDCRRGTGIGDRQRGFLRRR